jgi:hypothetical protein
MQTRARKVSRIPRAACPALLCLLIASLAFSAGPARAATGGEIARYPFRGFPTITSAAAPEEYEQPIQLEGLGPTHTIVQVNPEEVVVNDSEGNPVEWFYLDAAHDADGATVPTSLRVEGDAIILTVHHREGNPAAGFAPFAYPIAEGAGWAGGFRTISFEMNEPQAPTNDPAPAPAPTCTVPSLRGLRLRAAKARLRAADCTVGKVRLAPTATEAKGKVVKQFEPAGTQLAPGAPVAVRLARH